MTVEASSFKMVGGPQTTRVEMPKVEAPVPGLPPAPVPMGAANRVGSPESLPEQPADTPVAAAQAPVEATEDTEDATAVPEATTPTETASSRAARFAALARKEAEIHRARQQLKAERAAIEAQAQQSTASLDSIRDQARKDPLAVLAQLGLSYEGLTDHVLSGGTAPAVAAKDDVATIREELAQLREEQRTALERAERAAQERLNQSQEAVIHNFRREATEFVAANAEKYELTAAKNQGHLVSKAVEDHFMSTGQLLPLTTAADLVEKWLESELDALAATRKFQARVAAQGQRQQNQGTKPSVNPPAAKRPATLSNAFTASATSAASPRPRSDMERIQAALARLDGK